LKCDGTRAETRFRLSRETDESNLNRRGASVQSTTGSQGVRISGSNAGYTMFRGSVKSAGYPLHSPVSPFTSPPPELPCTITSQLESTIGQNVKEFELYEKSSCFNFDRNVTTVRCRQSTRRAAGFPENEKDITNFPLNIYRAEKVFR